MQQLSIRNGRPKTASAGEGSAAVTSMCNVPVNAPDVPTAIARLGEELLAGVACPPTDLDQIAQTARSTGKSQPVKSGVPANCTRSVINS